MLESVAFFVASVVIAIVMERKTDIEAKKSACQTPLHDMLHISCSNLSRYERYIDLIPLLPSVIVLRLMQCPRTNVHPCDVTRTVGLVLLLRAVSSRVTILPSPICDKKKPKSFGGCNACIFSGHAAVMLMSLYYIHREFPHLRELLLTYATLGSFLIVTTRTHYTIDVLVSWLAVYTVVKMHEDCLQQRCIARRRHAV